MENRPKLLLTAGFLFVVAVAVTSVFSAKAQNFIGPQSSAGVGQGAIGVDSSYNLAVGTTTTQADTKLLIVGTSTTSGYFAIKVLNLNTGPLFVVRSDGSVSIGSPQIQSNQTGSLTTITGVGTAPPNGSLYVNGPIFNTLDVKTNGLAVGTTTPQSGGNILVTGSITAIGTYSGTVNAGNISAGAFGGNTGGGNFSFPASVGVGTANPGSYRLYVSGGPAFFTNEIYSSGIWSTGYGPASSGGAITFKNWTAGELARIDTATGNVGIGNTAPAYKLDVAGTANFTQPILVGTPTAAGHAATKSYVDSSVSGGTSAGSFATLSVSGAWSISGAAGASLNLNGYNITGVNKLTVTTIDPVYEIGGVKYATYGADTVGLKVETYGKGTLAKNGNKNAYVIDFANAERGSDVWLFWQTIAEGANMEDVVVSLTPEGGNAQLWYVLKPEKKQIVVYGSAPVKFSYHLVAPRRDANQWKNVLVGSEEKGTVLSVK